MPPGQTSPSSYDAYYDASPFGITTEGPRPDHQCQLPSATAAQGPNQGDVFNRNAYVRRPAKRPAARRERRRRRLHHSVTPGAALRASLRASLRAERARAWPSTRPASFATGRPRPTCPHRLRRAQGPRAGAAHASRVDDVRECVVTRSHAVPRQDGQAFPDETGPPAETAPDVSAPVRRRIKHDSLCLSPRPYASLLTAEPTGNWVPSPETLRVFCSPKESEAQETPSQTHARTHMGTRWPTPLTQNPNDVTI
jgi:hypothetical protein